MFFGTFGSIFLLSQFFQTTQGLSPLESGLRVLPWTIMPMFVAPVAGILSDRIGSRPLMASGLALQAIAIGSLAAVSTPSIFSPVSTPAFEIREVSFLVLAIVTSLQNAYTGLRLGRAGRAAEGRTRWWG